jgi:hypothetical protein
MVSSAAGPPVEAPMPTTLISALSCSRVEAAAGPGDEEGGAGFRIRAQRRTIFTSDISFTV